MTGAEDRLSRVRNRLFGAVLDEVHRFALVVYRVLPVPLRRMAARRLTPSYGVGALAVLVRGGDVLMLRERHHRGWTLPGGLLSAGETPRQALHREVCEELALDVTVPDEPAYVHFDPESRHIDVFFVIDVNGRLADASPDGTEVMQMAWRPLDELDIDPPTMLMLERLRRRRQ